MAFDATNPADLAALKSEVNTDPLGLGYNLASTDDILNKLNNPESNTGLETGADKITPRNFLKAIWNESVSSQDQFKMDLLFNSVESINSDISEFRADLKALSNGISTAVDGIVRPVSRAEVLFADLDENGTIETINISRKDWIAARDS